jgi:hypothetical protein
VVDHFGNVLRRLHESSGVSQYKIAKDIGMASSNYNAMLNRKDMKLFVMRWALNRRMYASICGS